MAGAAHAIPCPKCGSLLFREEKIVQIDSTVVVRENLPIPARTVKEQYRYTCFECNTLLTDEWSPEDHNE